MVLPTAVANVAVVAAVVPVALAVSATAPVGYEPCVTCTGVIDAIPCTDTTLALAEPAVPGADPAIVVVSWAATTRWAPLPAAPAPSSAAWALILVSAELVAGTVPELGDVP